MKNPAAVALGRLGGSATSKAKTKAARINAKKGGWPKGRKRKPSVHKPATKSKGSEST